MNGESIVSKGQNSFSRDLKVGEPFKVSLTLINNSGLLMPPSYLVLDPYQFSEELKRIIKDLRGKMIVTSCFVIKVPKVRAIKYYAADLHIHSTMLTSCRVLYNIMYRESILRCGTTHCIFGNFMCYWHKPLSVCAICNNKKLENLNSWYLVCLCHTLQ